MSQWARVKARARGRSARKPRTGLGGGAIKMKQEWRVAVWQVAAILPRRLHSQTQSSQCSLTRGNMDLIAKFSDGHTSAHPPQPPSSRSGTTSTSGSSLARTPFMALQRVRVRRSCCFAGYGSAWARSGDGRRQSRSTSRAKQTIDPTRLDSYKNTP